MFRTRINENRGRIFHTTIPEGRTRVKQAMTNTFTEKWADTVKYKEESPEIFQWRDRLIENRFFSKTLITTVNVLGNETTAREAAPTASRLCFK